MSLIEEKAECLTYKVWWRQGRIYISLHKLSIERSLHSGLLIPEGEEQRFKCASSIGPVDHKGCLEISVVKRLCGLTAIQSIYEQTALRQAQKIISQQFHILNEEFIVFPSGR